MQQYGKALLLFHKNALTSYHEWAHKLIKNPIWVIANVNSALFYLEP